MKHKIYVGYVHVFVKPYTDYSVTFIHFINSRSNHLKRVDNSNTHALNITSSGKHDCLSSRAGASQLIALTREEQQRKVRVRPILS
jgi:hypothetical protein